MKKALFVLALMLMATTVVYNQTSRRSANTDANANRTERTANTNSEETKSTRSSTNQNNTRSTTTRSTVNTNSTSRNSNATQTRQPNPQGNSSTRTREANTSNERVANPPAERNNSSNTRTTTTTRSTTTTRTPGTGTSTSSRNTTVYTNQTRDSRNVHVEYPSSRRYTGTRTVTHVYQEAPRPREYRAVHYVYREPLNIHVVWTRTMYRDYLRMYPEVHYWYYDYGYRINNTSSYYADYYIGEVMTVYGQVNEVFYSRETDEYILYFGLYYPYQDFSVVIPGNYARKYSRRPALFFENQYIAVTGLITSFEGKPEIVVKRSYQLDIY